MSIETIILAQNLTTISSDSSFSYTNKTPGPGYYKQDIALRTVAYDLIGFVGTVKLQASLERYPGSNDWFDVTDADYTALTSRTSVETLSFSGNFVWLRAAYNLQGGQINRISVNGIAIVSSLSNATYVDLGAFEFTDGTISTTDSGAITIDNRVTITGDLTVGGDILPSGNLAADIGSSTNRFRDLYLSGSSIDLGGTTLGVVGGELQLGGTKVPTQTDLDQALVDVVAGTVDLTSYATIASLADVATSGDYTDLTNKPAIPVNINDLGDVALADPANGDLLTYFNGEWVNAALLNYVTAGSNVSVLNNDAGYITAADIADGTLTVDVNNTGDLKGSVFGDDSTMLVDSTNGKLVGDIDSNNAIISNLTVDKVSISSFDTNTTLLSNVLTVGADSVGSQMSFGRNSFAIQQFQDPEGESNKLYSQLQLSGGVARLLGRIETLDNLDQPTEHFGTVNAEAGRVTVQAYTGGTAVEWMFDESGITFPDATVQTTAWTGSVGNISVNTDFTITVDSGDSSPQVWQFDTGGVLTFPNGQQVDAEDANELLIGTPNAGLILNSTTQSSRLVAKKTFDREFNSNPDYTFSATVGPPHLITVTFDTDTGLYLLQLLERLGDKLSFGSTDFRFDYSNIRMVINPYAEAIPANILMVSQASGTTWEITIDQDPTAVVGNVTDLQILYDYNNTVGLDVGEDMFGIATDNDDIDIRSGRDIDLIAADDITFRAGSTFDLTLLQNDAQAPDDGLEIITESSTLTNIWKFQFSGLLQVPGNIAGTDGIVITPENGETFAYLNLPANANATDYGVGLGNDNGRIELRTTNQGTSNSYTWTFDNDGSLTVPGDIRSENNIDIEINLSDSTLRRWSFGEDGSLTLPSGVVLSEGGELDVGDLKITTTEPGTEITYDFSIGASAGTWALRFPDGSRQETALNAETIAQVGYRLQFDTDIYANETGGATDANETGVQFASNTVVRELFDLTPPATSTSARAYVDPLATEGQPDPNILEVTIVSGAPISVGMIVFAIVNGTPTFLGPIDSQTDATTFRIMGAPLTEEILIGTEFEFYGPGNFIEYAPISPITIFWDSGEETVVTAGSTNDPYGVNVFLVTAEDQTALTYPIEVATDNYAPAEFSHVIDADNDFKITTKANDFIINSNEGPLIIRNATSDYIFEGGTLTVPGTINMDGVGSVVGFATEADNFIGLEGQANWGVALRATDSQLDSKNWLFGTNGVLTLPGEGVIRSNNDTVILQSYDPAFNVGKGIRIGTNGHVFFELGDDPAYFQIGENSGDASLTAGANLNIVAGGGSSPKTWEFGTDGSLTLPDNGVVSAGGSSGLTLGGNFDVKIVADYTDNDRTWSFNGTNGSLTFPDSTVQETAWAGGRVVAVPTTSLGTTGDLEGDLAFNATYMYYCTQNFASTVINMTSISSSGISRAYIIMYDSNAGWTSDDLTGYVVSGPSYTGTVTGPSQDQGGGLWYIPVTPNVTQGMGTYTFTSPAGGDIWKRVAWSGDTW